MTGASIGGKLGGGWGAVGGAVIGLIAGNAATKRADEMSKKYNEQVVKFAAQDLFDLRRQQNIQNIRTSQALATYDDNRRVGVSTQVANMGAADIIGSSAAALAQTMDFQTKAAQAETMLNWETGIENYNTAIDTTTNQRSASLQRKSGAAPTDYGALLSGAVEVYDKYGRGEGAGMLADVRDAYNDPVRAASEAASIAKGAGKSAMSAFKNIWAESTDYMNPQSSGTTAQINSSVDDLNSGGFKTFAYK